MSATRPGLQHFGSSGKSFRLFHCTNIYKRFKNVPWITFLEEALSVKHTLHRQSLFHMSSLPLHLQPVGSCVCTSELHNTAVHITNTRHTCAFYNCPTWSFMPQTPDTHWCISQTPNSWKSDVHTDTCFWTKCSQSLINGVKIYSASKSNIIAHNHTYSCIHSHS